jgi:REP element-mobilizing transposase RayT
MSPQNAPYWHKRHLPHFEGGCIPQGVTFRLADSLPRNNLAILIEQLVHLDKTKAETERTRQINLMLDEGYGDACLKNPVVAEIVQNAVLFFNGQRYTLHAWVIMPTHVHALFTPAEGWTLSKILHSWKSFSAREANKVLNRTGEFWQSEYFDRAIRDERGFTAAIEYIEYNPVKAGLCSCPQEWRFSSAFRAQAF